MAFARAVLLLALSFASPTSSATLRGNDTAAVPIQSERQLRTFGVPRYPSNQPSLRWDDLKHSIKGQLGSPCDNEHQRQQCGSELVCRQSVCRHCIEDHQCPSLHRCAKGIGGQNLCVKVEEMAWERAFTDRYEFLCTVLIFFSCVLSAAAGTGGGGMFVPLLILFSGLSPQHVVPLSQAMILCSSFINLSLFVAQRHPDYSNQAKIDYDCVVFFEPLLILGVTMGVLGNQISPLWFQLGLLLLTLGVSLWRTGGKGWSQWKKEAANPVIPEAKVEDDLPWLTEFQALTNQNSRQVIGIFLIWLLVLIASFHGLHYCSFSFAVYLIAVSAILVLSTLLVGHYIIRRSSRRSRRKGQAAKDWVADGLMHFPSVAFGAGLLGGLLGLGGGIIIGPVLVEVGLHSEAVQATTASFVFLSSSIATIQFAILGMHVWHYVIWYGFVAIVATFLGQDLCDRYVKKRGRYSVITLSIAGVLLFSIICLTFVSFNQVSRDIEQGNKMWFSLERLCNPGDQPSIVAVDVTPSQSWPADLPHPDVRDPGLGFF